jgi:hypothetical protein
MNRKVLLTIRLCEVLHLLLELLLHVQNLFHVASTITHNLLGLYVPTLIQLVWWSYLS